MKTVVQPYDEEVDVTVLEVDALLCRRDSAIAIDVHASPFWLKDNERHF